MNICGTAIVLDGSAMEAMSEFVRDETYGWLVIGSLHV